MAALAVGCGHRERVPSKAAKRHDRGNPLMTRKFRQSIQQQMPTRPAVDVVICKATIRHYPTHRIHWFAISLVVGVAGSSCPVPIKFWSLGERSIFPGVMAKCGAIRPLLAARMTPVAKAAGVV